MIKTFFRKIVFPSIVSLSLEKVLPTFYRKRLILCYHGCENEPDFKINGHHLQARQFEKHLKYFRENFDIISLKEMFRLYRESIVPKKQTIALTFDDGYLNNYSIALPMLRKYSAPATFFVVSGSILDEHFVLWPDILDIIRAYSGREEFEIGSHTFRSINGSLFCKELGRTASIHIKQMGSERDALLLRMRAKYGFDDIIRRYNITGHKLMSKIMLKECSASGLVEIGSHSHSHYNLGNIETQLAKEELIKSKLKIEEAIQKDVSSIAFPDGHYNSTVKEYCLEAGYENLLAVSYLHPEDQDDKSILPRLTISNTTTFESNMIQLRLGFLKRGF